MVPDIKSLLSGKGGQKTVGFPHKGHAVIAPLSTSFLASGYFSLQGSCLDKNIEDFSPPAACRAPSSTVEAN